ncbi:hypothetical protein GGR58DRAFT_454029 [Xylaria digitata]|nr:hypothetical protein GGR58DRAFT_454029 [Xylaria digitata]
MGTLLLHVFISRFTDAGQARLKTWAIVHTRPHKTLYLSAILAMVSKERDSSVCISLFRNHPTHFGSASRHRSGFRCTRIVASSSLSKFLV